MPLAYEAALNDSQFYQSMNNYQRWSPRGHILKALASSPQKLPCPRLEDSSIFEPLKFLWKRQKPCGKSAKTFFWFPQVEIA